MSSDLTLIFFSRHAFTNPLCRDHLENFCCSLAQENFEGRIAMDLSWKIIHGRIYTNWCRFCVRILYCESDPCYSPCHFMKHVKRGSEYKGMPPLCSFIIQRYVGLAGGGGGNFNATSSSFAWVRTKTQKTPLTAILWPPEPEPEPALTHHTHVRLGFI